MDGEAQWLASRCVLAEAGRHRAGLPSAQGGRAGGQSPCAGGAECRISWRTAGTLGKPYLSRHVAVGGDQALVIGLRTDPNSKRNART